MERENKMILKQLPIKEKLGKLEQSVRDDDVLFNNFLILSSDFKEYNNLVIAKSQKSEDFGRDLNNRINLFIDFHWEELQKRIVFEDSQIQNLFNERNNPLTNFDSVGVTPKIMPSPGMPLKQIRIAIISANPKDTFPLRLDEELEAIIKEVQVDDPNCKASFIEPHIRRSTQFKDLSEALIKTKPHIIHFVGHGTKQGDLKIQGADGHSINLSLEQLLKLLKIVNNHSPLTAIIFNLCHSLLLFEHASGLFDYIVGWKGELPDTKGKIFAESFYRMLAIKACQSGDLDFMLAFEIGKLAADVMMEDSEGEVFLGGTKALAD